MLARLHSIFLPFPATRGCLHPLPHGPFFHLQSQECDRHHLHELSYVSLLSFLFIFIGMMFSPYTPKVQMPQRVYINYVQFLYT